MTRTQDQEGWDQEGWEQDSVRTRTGVVLPVRATARRPRWTDLPSPVREAITERLGSEVVRATSTGTGFTSGFASLLVLADGDAAFVKAASTGIDERAGWEITRSYREERRKLEALPSAVPAPRLRWHLDEELDGEHWVVLGLQAVEGRPPRRPWRAGELTRVCDALAAMAPAVAVAPAGLDLDAYADDFAELDAWTDKVRRQHGSDPWLEEVARLGRRSFEHCSGTALAHLDLRDDNLLLEPSGRVWICDWNWPLAGAPWLDLITVLISAHGDGIDTDAVIAAHPLTRAVDPEAVDSWLAALWLFFTTAKEQPPPEHSPHLRDHQQWYAEAVEGWLSGRLAKRSPALVRAAPAPRRRQGAEGR